jgi:chaperone modulatory protein CbpM
MSEPIPSGEVIAGEIVFNAPSYSLNQLCAYCHIHQEHLIDLVAFGTITVTGTHPSQWLFQHADVLRVQKAMRLQRDFALDQQGLALALELLDEIERLQQQLTRLHLLATGRD